MKYHILAVIDVEGTIDGPDDLDIQLQPWMEVDYLVSDVELVPIKEEEETP